MTPRGLILKLLLAADDGGLTTRAVVTAGQLMGLSENSLRVALARLSSQQLIETRARGEYQLGPAGKGLAVDVKRWRSGEARVVPWTGNWLAVHTAAINRSDRSALRLCERALPLLGLRELLPDLHVRPDNLSGGVEAARVRLHALGLPVEAAVMGLTRLEASLHRRAETLWDGKALSVAYRQQRKQLEQWLLGAPRLQPDVAAREAFVLGDAAIRSLVFDPLLPEPLVDVRERVALTDTVLRFDRIGHDCWRQLAEPQRTARRRVVGASPTGVPA